MQPVLSTAALPEGDRITAWEQGVRHWLARVRVARPRQPGPYEGDLWSWDLGYVRVLSMRADPVRLSRTARLVADAPDDRLALALQVSGTAALHQDGRSTAVRPGEMVLLDLRRPFSLEQHRPFRLHLLRVPERAVGGSGTRAERLTGRAIPTAEGVAALLGPFVSALVSETGRTAADVGDQLAGSVADLLATLIDEQTLGGPRPSRSARDHLLASIRRYIDDHLRDPGLSPARIADAHCISLRYLHLLFEGEETTVRRLIQRRRVEECAGELARRGRVAPTISAVAYGPAGIVAWFAFQSFENIGMTLG
ncbi:transcriptional regulator, partial [Streptomyces pharetrae]|uniref:AraC-like ligand-binding domain-containing protein n=1 Tax=Streptomyces pharetrae TaxID=291370 RepID=UPI0033455423